MTDDTLRDECRQLAEKLALSGFIQHDTETLLAFARAQQAKGAEHETPQSIADWANGTFGPATVARQIERAEEEWAEYYAACERGKSDQEKAEEVADTIICLSRVLVQLGFPDAVDEKMRINRARQWNVGPDGCAYHIKP